MRFLAWFVLQILLVLLLHHLSSDLPDKVLGDRFYVLPCAAFAILLWVACDVTSLYKSMVKVLSGGEKGWMT